MNGLRACATKAFPRVLGESQAGVAGIQEVRAPPECQKVFTLQMMPADPQAPRRDVAEASGCSLHAGLVAQGAERDKIEHLARYIARPPTPPSGCR